MFQKHIKAVSLVLVLCLIAAMFAITVLSGSAASGAVPEILLLIFVAAACVPVFLAHEKHD